MNDLKSRLSRGFTLLELLIVIAIIGILVSVAAASYTSAQSKSRDSRRKSDLKAWQNALEQYYADNSGGYPAGTCSPGATYLPAGNPTDPKNVAPYQYGVVSCTATAYCICVQMEQTTAGNSAAGCNYSGGKTHFCVSNLQ